jgi:hypothetical protein
MWESMNGIYVGYMYGFDAECMNEVDGGKSMYELMLKSMNGVDVGIHEWV